MTRAEMTFWIHLVNKLIMALSCLKGDFEYENPKVRMAWKEAEEFQRETDKT